MFMAGACGLVFIGIIRYDEMWTQSIHDIILNFYFIFLGVVIGISQYEFESI